MSIDDDNDPNARDWKRRHLRRRMAFERPGSARASAPFSCVAIAGAALLAACASHLDSGESDEEYDEVALGESRQAIRGGNEAGGVGAVELAMPHGSCSGALVGERMIVTAAHCFDDNSAGTALGTALEGFVYARVSYAVTGTTWICMSTGAAGKCSSDVRVWVDRMQAGGGGTTSDFAVVFPYLPGTKWSGVTGSNAAAGLYKGPLNTSHWFDLYGRGYNTPSGEGAGIMRVMSGMLDAVDTDSFIETAMDTIYPCHGDSGGPYFYEGGTWIFGVHSGSLETGNCAAAGWPVFGSRITQAKLDFINAQRSASWHPACQLRSTRQANYWKCP